MIGAASAPASTVAVVRCEGYEIDAVRAAVRRGIGLLGGVGGFVSEGERILPVSYTHLRAHET